jgi:hypothetical protein
MDHTHVVIYTKTHKKTHVYLHTKTESIEPDVSLAGRLSEVIAGIF